MNVVKEIQRINQRELTSGSASDSGSWHAQYKDTAWIFAGNIPFDLTEGDVVCIFSQYGEIIHIELIRDHKTGKSKGFAFLQYEDQRSTILAVDNLNGAAVLGRTLRVDHSYGPKKQKKKEGEEEESDGDQPKMNVAPELIEVGGKESKSKAKPVDDLDEDPMAAYFRDKNKSSKKEKKSKKKEKSSSSSSRHHKHKSSKESSSSHHRERSLSPADRRSRSPPPRRSYRDESPRRSRSPVRRSYTDESPKRSYRDDSPPSKRSYRDDTPPRRSHRDDSPPRKSYRRSRSRSYSPPQRRSRTRSRSPPCRY